MNKLSLLSCWLLLVGCLSVQGQDFHYSQFANAPLHLSPGLTGIFAGDTRIAANYRTQWASVPVDYQTFTVMADHKYTCGSSGPGWFSSGIALNYDRAGDSRLTWANVGLYGSYTYPTSMKTFWTFGLQAGLGQRSFDPDQLRFDEQFDVGIGAFNPNLGNGETFANSSHIFFDAGLGINFRWQALQRDELIDLLHHRSKVDIGVGLHHLTRPDMSFIEDVKVKLPMRFSPYVNATLQLGDPLDLRLAATAQFQSSYREYVGMAGLDIHFNPHQPVRQWALMVGIGYRFDEFGDAFFPALEINYHDQLRASISYDFNISDFQVATNRRGGLELSVRYLIKKVCPLPEFKFCPLI